MAARRIPMKKMRDILWMLLGLRLAARKTSRAYSVSHSTVLEYQQRAEKAELDWPEIEKMSDEMLERRLFPERATSTRPVPDWSRIHQELKLAGVTLQRLWEEYREAMPDGYGYSRFCDLYRIWRGKLNLSMRQVHKAGEKAFVDYCGMTVPITDPSTGEGHPAQIFVAVLGASNYTYAEATWSQQIGDWTGSHVRAFEYFGAVPEIVVPDNLRSGVSKACRYEPLLTRSYDELARHYGVAIIPARVRKPKDKAKAEAAVQVVERWILACLRKRRFFSLDELNAAIAELLESLNTRPFKKMQGTRRSHFEALDHPALHPLPQTRYEHSDWSQERVGADYHVEVDEHFYSVPYQLAGKQVDVRLKPGSVEILHGNRVAATHPRSRLANHSTSLHEHMPPSHRGYAEQTPEEMLVWARQVGASTAQVVEEILASKNHPYQGLRAASGLKRLARHYGKERLESACVRALEIRGLSYTSLHSILKRGLDRQRPPARARETLPERHCNVRGASYYSQTEEGSS